MPISRPLLIALVGAVLLGATFFAVQNARDNSSDDAASAAQQSTPDQQAAQAPPASPEELLQAAFKGGEIDSTAFSATVSVSAAGARASVELSGAFERGAANDVPELELSAEATAHGDRVEGGFVSLGDEAYFTQGETGWRVPDEVWSPVVEAAAKGAGAQPQNLPLSVDPQRWVRDVESEGTETVDGVETTHVSATVDTERVLSDVVAAARATGQQLPDAALAAQAVESAEFDAWIGTGDRVARRVEVELAFAQSGELSFELDLTGVNQPQDIEAPADLRQGMPSGLFGQFAQGLVTGLSGVTGVTGVSSADSASLAALSSPNPGRAARAVKAGKKVVILFQNPQGIDDRLMQRVARELDRRTQAVVLTDHVDTVDRYGKLVEDLGVSQTPAVVLIDRTGQARLIEGYVDTETLAQAVADAR